MLLAAQSHLGSKNLQVHMEPYLWKTRPDGVNVINVGKTWYVASILSLACPRWGIIWAFREPPTNKKLTGRRLSWLLVSSPPSTTPPTSV